MRRLPPDAIGQGSIGQISYLPQLLLKLKIQIILGVSISSVRDEVNTRSPVRSNNGWQHLLLPLPMRSITVSQRPAMQSEPSKERERAKDLP